MDEINAEIAAEWPDLPDPLPADPYDEDGYCDYCGNGRWKHHAPWCKWADADDAGPSNSWIDRHGDVWTLGDDGLMHTPETAPFPREHVEKKWGPLRPVAALLPSEPTGDETDFPSEVARALHADERADQ